MATRRVDIRREIRKACLVISLALVPLAAASLAPDSPSRRNYCPIILVHGILGYGQDEKIPISAWGGLGDFRRKFVAEGWEIYSATVGPVSSNWDRACELFAYIRGGRTDYGAAHSAAFGHERFGRSYPGVYAAWGSANKVHLICHSMGGQTARLLVQLLEAGSAQEMAASPDDASPLFAGGHSWVLGLITLCTPHDGTSMALIFNYDSEAAIRTICGILAAVSPTYDAMLEQWGLARIEGESAGSYADRLRKDLAWYLGEDGCHNDLSPSGAAELNGWIRAWPDVYYFSWAASCTFEYENKYLPSIDMQPLLAMNAVAMGGFQGRDGPWTIGPDWWENDGVVNTISMDGPKLNSTDRIVPFSGAPVRGEWNYMGCLARTDHVDLLGFGTPLWYAPPGFKSCEDWYRYNLGLVASLED
jgi:triacylglycerol lipase